MIAKKYVRIKEDIIVKDNIFEFDIYFYLKDEGLVKLIKEKNSTLSSHDVITIREKKDIYVGKSDKHIYEKYYQEYLALIAKDIKTKKMIEIYSKAAHAIEEIYNNPETLGGNEKSKEVVNDLVSTILDDDFTVTSLMSIATHDYYTHTHSLNVAIYALSLGAFLKLDIASLKRLGHAGFLHDLGKKSIDLKIINKNGSLSKEEFDIVKTHSELGYIFALKMGVNNKQTLDAIRYHHEKIDGSGYPFGLKGEEIPFFARVISICDVFDALTSMRSYKKALNTYDALFLIKTEMKHHLDMDLLKSMIKMFR